MLDQVSFEILDVKALTSVMYWGVPPSLRPATLLHCDAIYPLFDCDVFVCPSVEGMLQCTIYFHFVFLFLPKCRGYTPKHFFLCVCAFV